MGKEDFFPTKDDTDVPTTFSPEKIQPPSPFCLWQSTATHPTAFGYFFLGATWRRPAGIPTKRMTTRRKAMMHPLIWVMGPMLLKKRISWKFVSWSFGDPSGDFFGWGDGDGGKGGGNFRKRWHLTDSLPCWRNLFVNSGVIFQNFEYLDLVNFQSLFAKRPLTTIEDYDFAHCTHFRQPKRLGFVCHGNQWMETSS